MLRVRVGYCGGDKEKPTYHSLGDHTEAVAIDYDPKVTSYEKLLEYFWRSHRCDRTGSSRQYMNAIFHLNENQQKQAIASLKSQSEKQRIAIDKITTQVAPAKDFTYAEGYHQKYYLGSKYRELRDFLLKTYPTAKEIADSTVATRVNAYLGSGLDKDWLAFKKELPSYGLPEKIEARLLELANSKL